MIMTSAAAVVVVFVHLFLADRQTTERLNSRNRINIVLVFHNQDNKYEVVVLCTMAIFPKLLQSRGGLCSTTTHRTSFRPASQPLIRATINFQFSLSRGQ